MASIRQQQVASVVQREFSMVLQQEGTYIYGTAPLVTVTQVMVTPDLSEARIYLSIYNIEDKQTVLLELEENMARLRQLLSTRIRKKVRRIPKISLYYDDTLDEMYRINALFDRLEADKQMGKKWNDGLVATLVHDFMVDFIVLRFYWNHAPRIYVAMRQCNHITMQPWIYHYE